SALLADKEHTPALAACPATPDVELIKYRNLALYGKIKEGRQQLEHRLTQNPKNPAILYGLGLAWARVNRRAKAIDYFNHALDLAPQNPAIQVELGRVLAIDGQSTTAQKILTPLTRDPLLGPQARFYLGLALMDAGDIPGAQSHFTALAKGHGKQFPKSYFYLARLAAQEKRQDLSHYYLGIFYQETKDNKNALRHLKKALDTLKDPVKKEDAKKRLEAIKPGKPHKRP
ncbi:MAG: tetratricopeptide repeat protein, partial [Desulfovibrionales bacterium]|nr:tetratricopeptide repeat protein [Desulfovibrionales bacterium]